MRRYLSRQFLCRPLPLVIIGAIVVLVLLCASCSIFLGVSIADLRAHTYKAIGPSMEPTIHDGQLLTTQDYGKSTPQRSDIVIFHPPTDRSAVYLLRIIGLPGERVDVTDAAVLINGKPLQEPYLGPHFAGNGEGGVTQLTLGKDRYYVLGDNRQYSIDSRLFGAITKAMIMAKVVTISK